MHTSGQLFSIHSIRFLIIVAMCLFGLRTIAQINEDFTDPDLTSNPCWSGAVNRFEVNAYHQLHLKATGADTSVLSTPLTCSNSMEWKFWVHLAFAPSDNNNARIYIAADQSNPILSNKAFYIQLGEAGSQDAIILFYKEGHTLREVCRGTPGLIANPFSVRIRVVRLSNGTWKIVADPTGGCSYANEASGIETAPLPDGYFALYCKYTSSNSTGFYFDDILVHPYTVDASPPRLIQATVSGDNQIQLNFSEPVEKTTSTQLTNFSLADGTHPANVYSDPLTGTVLKLDFTKPLPIDKSFTLSYNGITDLDGNVSNQQETNLIFHAIRTFDVLISEIMSDPTPAKGLPECEYLELYNRTAFPINLNNWTLQTGKSVQPLPDSIIAAHAWSIITTASDAPLLRRYGSVIALKSLTLSNEGCLIALKDKNGQVIHAVDFKPAWHDVSSKINGGWSLEMIDPMNPCGEGSNYRSSVDVNGGTPGSLNSVNAIFPDTQCPQLISVFPTDSMHLRIDFSETLDSNQLSDPKAYTITPSMGQPKDMILNGPLYHSLLLELNSPLQHKIIYSLIINQPIHDCSGNELKIPFNIQFGLPVPLIKNGIVINEIMFDPGPDKEEFIEIYNRSASYFDLSQLRLMVENINSSIQKPPVSASEEGQLIPPYAYLVLTADKKSFLKQYPLLTSGSVIEVPGFQTLSNEGGEISITDSTGNCIDKADFNPSMHYQLLRTTTGVSLERINPDTPSDSKSNWYSAAGTAGYATPGKINSQHIAQNPSTLSLLLEPDQFTPDNDGMDDNLFIRFNPESPGCMMTILIYDLNGLLIRRLASNVMLATENTFTWDGLTEDHTKAKPGIYVVFAELYYSSGTVRHLKKTAILAPSLKR